MIARRKDSSAALSKTGDTLTVFRRKPLAGINCEEPQFIEVPMIQLTQDCIVAGGSNFPITRCHLDQPIAICVGERAEIFAQQRKTFNRPIVVSLRNSGLQENSNWLSHMFYLLLHRGVVAGGPVYAWHFPAHRPALRG